MMYTHESLVNETILGNRVADFFQRDNNITRVETGR